MIKNRSYGRFFFLQIQHHTLIKNTKFGILNQFFNSMHNYLFQLIIITLLATVLIHIPIWVLAQSKNVFKRIDIIYTFIPSVVWLILTALGIGSLSMTNVFEIPIVILFTVLTYVFLYFSHFESLRTGRGRAILISILVIFIVLLRTLTPVIPG